MIKYLTLSTVGLILALAIPRKPAITTGTWQVDERHSDAQLSTDGTTGFGKTKMNFTIGFGRANGTVKLDGADSANSAFDFRFYPATSIAPTIGEDGKVEIEWFTNHANNTLVCFHSKGATLASDGRLRTTGNLTLTRVDRNVEVPAASEAYSGPVYGPPILHRVSRPATFIFDVPAVAGGGPNKGSLETSGSTNVVREDFPQLLKAVIATHWPPVVREKNCQVAGAGEAYAGSLCTGAFVDAPALPLGPSASGSEDYPGPQNFNSVTGEHLTIVVHMRLTPQGSGAPAGTGN